MVVVRESPFIRSKVVVVGQKWLYSGENGSISGKISCIRSKVVVIGQSGCL